MLILCIVPKTLTETRQSKKRTTKIQRRPEPRVQQMSTAVDHTATIPRTRDSSRDPGEQHTVTRKKVCSRQKLPPTCNVRCTQARHEKQPLTKTKENTVNVKYGTCWIATAIFSMVWHGEVDNVLRGSFVTAPLGHTLDCHRDFLQGLWHGEVDNLLRGSFLSAHLEAKAESPSHAHRRPGLGPPRSSRRSVCLAKSGRQTQHDLAQTGCVLSAFARTDKSHTGAVPL